MTDAGTPIAYTAVHRGLPVQALSGLRIGTVDRVLADVEADIFHGFVVKTPQGRRVVTASRIEAILSTGVVCRLTDEEVQRLPEPTAAQRSTRDETIYASTSDGPKGFGSRFVVIVRCSRGGLFHALWVPGVSITAVRLGPYRIMRCPVHERVELVHIVDPADLTPLELELAAKYPARRVP